VTQPPVVAQASALPVAAAGAALQARVQTLLTRSGPLLRYRLMRVGPAGLSGVSLLLAAAVAIGVLLMPAQHALVNLQGELTKAGHAGVGALHPEATPQQFAGTLPTREQVPAVLGVLLVQANESNVALEQGKYTFTPAAQSRLARYTFEFPVKGNYTDIRTFITKALTAVPALGLDKLHIERKNVGDASVNAEVGFVIYLRGA
jgi:hypothetical protein